MGRVAPSARWGGLHSAFTVGWGVFTVGWGWGAGGSRCALWGWGVQVLTVALLSPQPSAPRADSRSAGGADSGWGGTGRSVKGGPSDALPLPAHTCSSSWTGLRAERPRLLPAPGDKWNGGRKVEC